MLAVRCLLFAVSCWLMATPLGAELAFKWTVEVSQPLPYAAEALQGESFNLEAKVVQYRVPMLEAAEATFYYQTPEMEASQWYTVPAAWDATTATASVAFMPAMDVGSSKYRFFFGIETAQGKNYRVFGTLRLKASPGFSPATLEPTDVRAEMIQEIVEAVFEESDERYATKAEHAALAVQVQGKAPASHTHSDLVKQRDVQQVLNESEHPVSAKAVYQNVGNVVRNPDIVDVVRYVDAGSLQEIGNQHGKAIFAADSDGQGGIIVGGSRTSQPCWTQWTAKLNWDKIRAYNDPGLYEDYSFKPGESNQIARMKDLPAAITVDSALSYDSTNPVQNKVVYAALASRPIPTVSQDMSGMSIGSSNGKSSFYFLSDGGVTFSTTSKGDTRSATLVGQATLTAALESKASVQHQHLLSDLTLPLASGTYHWVWDEAEGTFALLLE